MFHCSTDKVPTHGPIQLKAFFTVTSHFYNQRHFTITSHFYNYRCVCEAIGLGAYSITGRLVNSSVVQLLLDLPILYSVMLSEKSYIIYLALTLH